MRDDIARSVESRGICPVYILYGEDHYSQRQAADELVEAIVSLRGGADTNTFDAAECAVDDIVSAVMTAPMFASARVVVVRRFDEMPGADQAKLISIVAPGKSKSDLRIPDDTVMIITSGSKSIPRREAAAGGVNVSAFEFRQGYARGAQDFAISRARELGAAMDEDAASLLVELSGTDLGAISSEIDKLITYLGGKHAKIAVNDISAAVGRSSIQTVFTFCDAAIEGDPSKAMLALSDLLRTEKSALGILNTLATQVRGLMKARAELDRGRRPDELIRELSGGNQRMEWKARKTVAQARKLSQRSLAGIVSRLAQADLNIKTGESTETLAMELLVLDLAVQQKLQRH
ncbi:MAG: DNA polymerase III subunit delta [Clostridia bacterium]|nr:DNA polymerase III subunit delta [Clostridia bacterium]